VATVVALDFEPRRVRAVAVDGDGRPLASASHPHDGEPGRARDAAGAALAALADLADLAPHLDRPPAALGVAQPRPDSGPYAAAAGPVATPLGPVPLTALVTRRAAALAGLACFEPGMAAAVYGPGAGVIVATGAARPEPPAATGLRAILAWDLGRGQPAWALEADMTAVTTTLAWLEGFGVLRDGEDAAALAAAVRTTEGVHLVPAFDDATAGTLLVGLTRGLGRPHLARAALEAAAHQVRDLLDATGLPLTTLRVEGPVPAAPVLLQAQADQLQVPVALAPAGHHPAALGAAWLAGLAVGLWASPADLAPLWQAEHEYRPAARSSVADARHREWRRAVERARGWAAG
jgi:glycerol kinase